LTVPASIPEPAQELVAAQSTAVAQVGPDGFPIGSPEQIAASMGFGGLNFDAFGIVPIVSLTNHGFEMSDGSPSLGEEFFAVLGSQRNKYLYSYQYLPAGKTMAESNLVKELLYSYDQITNTNGSYTIEQFTKDAVAHGCEVTCKLYHEVSATLVDGRIVNLSIPNAGSGNSLTRFILACIAQRKMPSQVWARIYRGAKVEGPKVKFAFTPWAIDVHSDV
jgi:hypothetical protein